MKNLGDFIVKFILGSCISAMGVLILRYSSKGIIVSCQPAQLKTINCVSKEAFVFTNETINTSEITGIKHAKVATIQASLSTESDEKVVPLYQVLVTTDDNKPSQKFGRVRNDLGEAESIAQQLNAFIQNPKGQPIELKLDSSQIENPTLWFAWGAIVLGIIVMFVRTNNPTQDA